LCEQRQKQAAQEMEQKQWPFFYRDRADELSRLNWVERTKPE
jgi:hypothetical protein